MLSKSEKILMSLNSKRHFANWQPQNSYPKETNKRVAPRKWQKGVWVWCLRVVVLSLSNPTDHGCPQTFFQGGQCRHFSYLFQVVGDATQMDVHKKENVQRYGNSCIQCFPCKKTLQWTNVCFSEHGFFMTELAEFWVNYQLCEFLECAKYYEYTNKLHI